MFITFEGIEGSGKTTAMRGLEKRLLDRGCEVLLTREPGGCDLGLTLRKILLDIKTTNLTARAELFLYLADRAQHIEEIIRPALDSGKIVLCDRFADSTVVYQGYGRGLDLDKLRLLNDIAVTGLWPERTYLLDLSPQLGLKRAMSRNFAENKAGSEGRFEAESLDFHNRIREGYLTWAALNKERFRLVGADLSPEEVLEQIWTDLEPELPAV